MSKRLRRILASLLVLTLFVASMPFAALSETAPAEEFAAEATEAPAEEPEAESTEAPVEESVAESTEAPAEEPEEESTEVPAEEPEAEATGVPAEEPEAEATEMPAEEPEAEATEMPAEEETDVPDGEITEEAIALASTEEISCAHEHTYSEEVALKGSDYNGKYGEYNEDNGTFDGVYYNEKYDVNGIRISKVIIYCSDCKEKLKEELKYDRSDSWLFFHNFDEDNGCKCRNCGFVCPHIETYEFEVSEDYDLDYVAVNEKEHQYTVTYIEVETVCEACGKWISSEKINKTETVVEKHSCYNGVCWDCGYVYDSCKHENVLRAGADDGEWISIDENYHMNDMTFNWSDKYDYCRDCGCSLKDGKVVKNFGDDEAGEDRYWTDFGAEPHVFENGVCKLCGYQKQEEVTCDHSAGNFRDELDMSVAPKYSNITDTTHCVQYSYKRYCKDCGEYITNVADEGITPVAHDFSNGDTCVCGYSKQEDDEQKPYVRGFKMSKTSVKVGDAVKFTLDIANFKDGETVKLQFRADEWTEDFNLTAPNNVFEHQFSRAGNRQIQFRVVDGEWCSAQTLKVTAQAAEVKTMRLSSTYIEEQKDGGTITATVTCNNATSLVDLYVNDKRVKQSSTYTEENGNRVFAISFKLGGNGKYAGEYKIRAAALKEAYASEWDNSDVVTLTVRHNYEASGKDEFKDYWKKSANGHTRYRQVTAHYVCQVCNAEYELSGECAIGSLQPHTIDNDTGECTVCGYKKINPPQDDPKMSTDYKESEFYQKLKKVNLTGDYAEDIVNVARSQIGYTETGNNNTVYGAFTGGNNLSWCASFVSWCASKAGLSDVFKIGTAANPDWVLKKGYLVWYFAEYPSWKSKNAAPGEGFCYFMSGADVKEYDPDRNIVIPQKGDLVFFATVQEEPWAHIGIVTGYDSDTQTITYIDGNGSYESTKDYPAKLIAGKKGNIAVSEWKIGLKNQNICAIARPNY